MQGRNKKGRYKSGNQSDEQKQKISEGQIKRYMRDLKDHPRHLPETKRCSTCQKWKQIDGNFVIQKRKLKSGDIALYPQSSCNECLREKRRKYRDENREHLRKINNEAEKKRMAKPSYKKKRQSYQREYGRMTRALNGANSRGPWKKHKDELDKRLEMVDVAPFVAWWESLGDEKPRESNMGPVLARAVRRAVSGETKKIHLDIIDEVGIAAGEPSLYRDLYPT